MKKNRFLQWLKRPRGFCLALIYIFALISIAASIVLSVFQFDNILLQALTYVAYVLAAVFLGYTVYTIVIYSPVVSRKVKNKLMENKIIANVMSQYGNKTLFFSILSMVMNIAFAVINGVSAIIYKSLWFGSLAGYYTVLILFRGGLIIANFICNKRFSETPDKFEESKIKIYLSSGAFLVIIEIAMAIAITQMVIYPKPVVSGQIMAISTAAYTFYAMTMSVINLIQARRFSDPVTQSFRNLNFATACMSMLSLTVSLISTFGDGADYTSMKAVVGFSVCSIIIILATYMIIRAGKLLTAKKENVINE